MSEDYIVEAIYHSRLFYGEAPYWDIFTENLYFVDQLDGKLLRYDYNENKTYEASIAQEQFIGFIIPIDGKPNHFAVGLQNRVCEVKWDGKCSHPRIKSILFEVEKDLVNCFNDAKVDPMGRFYGGTMPIKHANPFINTERTGNLYCYDENIKKPIKVKNNVAISNGLDWNTKTKKFFYIDSADLNILEYDYNIRTGEIKNPQILVDFHLEHKRLCPCMQKLFCLHGMTIDSNGSLYVANYGAGRVLKINSLNGEIEMEIKLPCLEITSVAFGGKNLDILFVTTASKMKNNTPAGLTFKITGLGVKGKEMSKLRL